MSHQEGAVCGQCRQPVGAHLLGCKLGHSIAIADLCRIKQINRDLLAALQHACDMLDVACRQGLQGGKPHIHPSDAEAIADFRAAIAKALGDGS